MSLVKKITRIIPILFVLLSSCSLLKSDEAVALKRINRHERKLRSLYAEFPQFKKSDTLSGVVTIPNPVVLRDTTILFRDSIRYKNIERIIYEKCKDPILASRVITEVKKIRCISDSIKIDDALFKAVVKQDSLGAINVVITPKDTALSKKYSVVVSKPVEKKYYEYAEFWALVVLLLIVIGFLIWRLKT